jgi:hypothetical protein
VPLYAFVPSWKMFTKRTAAFAVVKLVGADQADHVPRVSCTRARQK